MNRREFLQYAAMVSAGLALSDAERLFAMGGSPQGWRTFEVTTHVEILNATGPMRVWLPAALIRETPFQKTLSNRYTAKSGTAEMTQNEADGLGIVAARFPAGVKPVLTLTSRVATRNYSVDLSNPGKPGNSSPAELRHFLRPTKLIPTDGIVKQTASEITRGATSDVQKARAIYEWIVDNTFRDPKVRGCGRGNIRAMLESGDLGGKCADLNALYVGLARAAGLPARDVYGIRVAKSQLGFKSLGPATENVTKAQHCRAEVYLEKCGWVPVDPADVRKVVLEEPPGNRALNDEVVKEARAHLFGAWEMNWVAYNFAHDVILPGSKGAPVAFLMYPEAETADGTRLDSLDPDKFRYEITAKEITATA